jgi:hypothetical protein
MFVADCAFRCGSQFTAKLEGMMNDLFTGTDHAKSLEEYCQSNAEARAAIGKMEFTAVQVTTKLIVLVVAGCLTWYHESELSCVSSWGLC